MQTTCLLADVQVKTHEMFTKHNQNDRECISLFVGNYSDHKCMNLSRSVSFEHFVKCPGLNVYSEQLIFDTNNVDVQSACSFTTIANKCQFLYFANFYSTIGQCVLLP